MSATIQKRVEALEHTSASGRDFILILRRIIKPGVSSGEATQARMFEQHFKREPTETEADFIVRLRACGFAHRRPGQLAVQVLMGEIDLDP